MEFGLGLARFLVDEPLILRGSGFRDLAECKVWGFVFQPQQPRPELAGGDVDPAAAPVSGAVRAVSASTRSKSLSKLMKTDLKYRRRLRRATAAPLGV